MVFHRRVDFVIMAAVGMIVLSGLSGCGAKEEPEDTTPEIYTCAGAPASCLRIASGWTFEGTVLSQGQTGNGGPDPFIVRLDDGRYRLYYAVSDVPADPDWWGMVSWISDDGLYFTKEAGYRIRSLHPVPALYRPQHRRDLADVLARPETGPGQRTGIQGHQERFVDRRRRNVHGRGRGAADFFGHRLRVERDRIGKSHPARKRSRSGCTTRASALITAGP